MAIHLGQGRERAGPNPSVVVMPPGVELFGAKEGVPIIESALIAQKLAPVFLSHEGCPFSGSCCWSWHCAIRAMTLVDSHIMVSFCAKGNAVTSRIKVSGTGRTHYRENP